MNTDQRSDQVGGENEVERLSRMLKEQVKDAKARISERYGKLMEDRSFDPSRKRKA